MAWQDILTLVSLAGVVVAIVIARRKGRARFSASIAAARAEGHANATAELSAKLVNHVQVVAGNNLPGEVDRESDAIVSALRFLAVESQRASMRDDDRHSGRHDLDALLSGRRSDDLSTDDLSDGRVARLVDRNGSVRDLGTGSQVIP